MEIAAGLGATVWLRYCIRRRGKVRESIRCTALTLDIVGRGLGRAGRAAGDEE